jgi:Protein of unknown function (DUF4197)
VKPASAGLRLAVLVPLIWFAPAPRVAAAPAGVQVVADAASSRREVLTRSARQAVARLARDGGFSGDPEMRFDVPPALREADRLLRLLGARNESDRFRLAMYQTAEVLAGKAEPLLLAAIRDSGPAGPPPWTEGFRRAHEPQLLDQLTPLARELTRGELISRVYGRVVKQATRFGYTQGEAPPLDRYLAQQTLIGLFTAMAHAERALDPHPAGG